MIRHSNLRRRGRAWLLLLGPAFAVLTGLLGMHGLSSAQPPAYLEISAHGSHEASSHLDRRPPCAHPTTGDHHEPCPGHQHPGPVCKSGSVPTGTSLGNVPTLSTTGPAAAVRLSFPAAAERTATGTGRSPPSLLELSISRT